MVTMEELREMVGEPVYDFMGDEWFVIGEINDTDVVMTDGAHFGIDKSSQDTAVCRFFRCRVGKWPC